VNLRDLRHVLTEVLTPSLYAAQEGRPGTRPRLAKLHQAAAELLLDDWPDFEARALLREILARTEETASLNTLREENLLAFARLLKARIAELESIEGRAAGVGQAVADGPSASEQRVEPSAATGAGTVVVRPNVAVARQGPTYKRWLLISVLGLPLALGGLAVVLRQQEQDCPQGYYRREGACVDPKDPLERYTTCIIKDKKWSVSSDKGTEVQVKVDAAKRGATTAVQAKNKFEQSVERNTDRCVVLDVSARCFALATDQKLVPPHPSDCAPPHSPPLPTPTPTPASASTKARPQRVCPVDLTTFNLGKPACSSQTTSRPATGAEATQLKSTHANCDAFNVFYCQ
jgi:hypothetical protein